MTGVKDFIQEFKEPFNRIDKATKRAKKNLSENGVQKPSKDVLQTEVEAVMVEWDHKRQRGEDYQKKLCQKEVETNTSAILGVYKSFDPLNPPEIGSCKLEPNKVYLEKYLFSKKYQLQGYADRIDTKGNIINIADNKVVEKIYRSAPSKAENGFQIPVKKMFMPIQNLDSCNYIDFVLQLSLYMYLAWECNKDMKVGKLFIRHIVMNDADKVVSDKTFEVPYMKDEVKKMLKYKLDNQ